ncbi:aldo/keto reductase (plasmid) [Aminobacter sp. UC22_36]|uniref:aldo/keto reductase n=1 Tax=Aminobacter sp. UC22_36 TaxID=3374549 RepID=UPI0037563C00
MEPFQTRRLGGTDVMLPQIGFGAAPLGELFTKVTEHDAEATLAGAWDAGIRYYDTAPWYGRGQSEHRVGRFLYRQPRNELILSTKVGRILRAPARPERFDTGFWAGGLHFEHHFDYTYDGVMRAYEDSLQRLGMNRVDLLVIHDLDVWHQGSQTMVAAKLAQLANGGYRALADLKAAGMIRAIGAGINELGMIPRLLELFDMDFLLLALKYTLGEQETLDAEIPLCVERNVGLIIGGVFNSGLYATGPVPNAKYNYADPTPAQLVKAEKIAAVCARHGVPLIAAALQFPLLHPQVTCVIPGAFARDQVTANLAHVRRDIPADLWAELKHEGLIHADAPISL